MFPQKLMETISALLYIVKRFHGLNVAAIALGTSKKPMETIPALLTIFKFHFFYIRTPTFRTFFFA